MTDYEKPFRNDKNVVAFNSHGALWIPFIMATPDKRMKQIMDELVEETGLTWVHFTSVMSLKLVEKLRGFKPEKHYFDKLDTDVLCTVGEWRNHTNPSKAEQ